MMNYQQAKHGSFSVVMLFIALSLSGVACIPLLSLHLFPFPKTTLLDITYHYRAGTPELMEKVVTSKAEGVLSKLQGIKNIWSFSGANSVSITVELDRNKNLDLARIEVSSLLRVLHRYLPAGIGHPSIQLRQGQAEKPLLMTFSLSGNADAAKHNRLIEELHINLLSRLRGISQTRVSGMAEPEWKIFPDDNKLLVLDISHGDIHRAMDHIVYGTSVVPQVILEDNPDLTWSDIIVEQKGGRMISLTDVASVRRTTPTIYPLQRVNGRRACIVDIYAKPATNTLVTARKLKRELASFADSLPEDYEIHTEHDDTEILVKELFLIFKRTALTLLLLFVLVSFITKDRKIVSVLFLSIICTLTVACLIYYIIGIEIHIYSLAGLTVSLGIIMDNSIMMTEELRAKGSMKIIRAITGSSLTSMAALSAVFLLPDEYRYSLQDFAMLIMINLLVSIGVSLFLTPAIFELIHSKPSIKQRRSRKLRIIGFLSSLYCWFITRIRRFALLSLLSGMLGFGLPLFLLPVTITGDYMLADWYNNTIGNSYFTAEIKPYLDKYLGGAFRLFTLYVDKQNINQQREGTLLFVKAHTVDHHDPEKLDEVFSLLERQISNQKKIARFTTEIQDEQHGSMKIYFREGVERTIYPVWLKEQLIAMSLQFGGIEWNIYGVGDGYSNLPADALKQFRVFFYGYDYNHLQGYVLAFAGLLRRNPRFSDLDLSGTTPGYSKSRTGGFNLSFDPLKLALTAMGGGSGKTKLDHNSDVNAGTFGLVWDKLGAIRNRGTNRGVKGLMNDPVDGNNLRFSNISKLTELIPDNIIYRDNQNYVRVVRFNYNGIKEYGDRFVAEAVDEMERYLPPGYTCRVPSTSEDAELDSWLWLFLLLIMIMIYLVCAVLFESVTQPLIILLMVPLSYIGVFLTFFCFELKFGLAGMASLMLLGGLVVNAAIYLVNEYNSLDVEKPQIDQLTKYMKAFNRKIIPISLTLVSTIAGLIPFILLEDKDGFWFTLAAGTTGGLIFSLIPLLIFLPLIIRGKVRKT